MDSINDSSSSLYHANSDIGYSTLNMLINVKKIHETSYFFAEIIIKVFSRGARKAAVNFFNFRLQHAITLDPVMCHDGVDYRTTSRITLNHVPYQQLWLN